VSPMSLQGCYTYPYFHATNKWHAHTIELHTTPMVFPCFSWVRTDLKSASFFVLCVCVRRTSCIAWHDNYSSNIHK
jgi:hypothetical protein